MQVSLPIAFVAGLSSFFAPCVIPLFPIYLSFITGVTLAEAKQITRIDKTKIIWLTINYVIGFSLVFVLMGATAAGWGTLFRQNQDVFQRIGGLVIILLGFQQLGVITLPSFIRTKSLLPGNISSKLQGHSFFLGVVFAVTWTPCVGVILGAILTLAAVQATVVDGALLLFAYSLGLSLPFVIASVSVSRLPRFVRSAKQLFWLYQVTSVLLIVMGLLLLTDTYKYVNAFVFEIAFRLGYTIQ